MKNLILFATYTNTCREIAEYIEDKLPGDTDFINIVLNLQKIDFNKYDNIILGSYNHNGKFNKKFVKFLKKASKLGKKTYVFITGCNFELKDYKLEKIQELSKGQAFSVFAGGTLRPEQAPMKIVATILMQTKLEFEIDEKPLPEILYSEVDKLIDEIYKDNNIEKKEIE